jgi:hypothetical protein
VRAALKVDAFASGAVRHEDAHFRIFVEGDYTSPSRVTRHAAVDDHDRLGFADGLPDLVGEIEERVARLGKDYELAPLSGCLVNDRRLVEDFRELPPLGVLA